MSDTSCPYDPFKDVRKQKGIHIGHFDGEEIPMILRYHDVRSAAKDWATYSSDTPFRVPIPSEEDVRSYRQLPIETNPPDHTEYRELVEPLFRRPQQQDYIEEIEKMIDRLLESKLRAGIPVEVVSEFALPLQCKALTRLLRVPESEADTWLLWGMHPFLGEDRQEKGADLERYLERKFIEAKQSAPGDDFFSILAHAEFRGRPLTLDEMMGFGNLAFAGGRDTVINMVTAVIGYMAEHPEAITKLRENPKLIPTAAEEFARIISPVSRIGRTCPTGAHVAGHTIKPGQRVALTWASANFDDSVFDAPDEIRLDRKPNPHVAYGFGPHVCLGAPHARTLIRSLLKIISIRLERIDLLTSKQNRLAGPNIDRHGYYDSLEVRFLGLKSLASNGDR